MFLPDALGLGDAGDVGHGFCRMTFAVSHTQICVIILAAYADSNDVFDVPFLADLNSRSAQMADATEALEDAQLF
jgi:hypothetical protein